MCVLQVSQVTENCSFCCLRQFATLIKSNHSSDVDDVVRSGDTRVPFTFCRPVLSFHRCRCCPKTLQQWHAKCGRTENSVTFFLSTPFVAGVPHQIVMNQQIENHASVKSIFSRHFFSFALFLRLRFIFYGVKSIRALTHGQMAV